MSLQKPYHIKGKDFERAYKDYLSDFRTWKHLGHASKHLIFPRNLGPNVTKPPSLTGNYTPSSPTRMPMEARGH